MPRRSKSSKLIKEDQDEVNNAIIEGVLTPIEIAAGPLAPLVEIGKELIKYGVGQINQPYEGSYGSEATFRVPSHRGASRHNGMIGSPSIPLQPLKSGHKTVPLGSLTPIEEREHEKIPLIPLYSPYTGFLEHYATQHPHPPINLNRKGFTDDHPTKMTGPNSTMVPSGGFRKVTIKGAPPNPRKIQSGYYVYRG